MKFRSAYDKGENKYISPSGEKVVYEHREEIDTRGRRRLLKDRAVDVYEKIQASAEQCEITNILRRAAEGDYNALNMVNGQYLDIVGAPASLAEAQQFVINAKNQFEKLPKEVRAKFENNAEMYVANYGSEMWEEATGIKAAKELEKSKKENEKKFKVNLEKAVENLTKEGAIVNE